MAKADRPKTVLTGHLKWTVEYLKQDDWDSMRDKWPEDYGDGHRGETQWNRCNIAILDESTEDMIRDALFHEVTHAAWGACGLSYVNEKNQLPRSPFDREEFVVTMQTPAILSALQLNPKLTRYLMGND
jgi:hypothetical protein